MDAFEKIEYFKKRVIHIFSDRLSCIILTGSYTKGDYRQDSDIDIWIIINRLCNNDLVKIGEIIRETHGTNEVNAQCLDSNEIQTKPFRREFNPIQLYLDGIVLFGHLPEYNPYFSEIRNYLLSICVQVVMSTRHYITADESEESLSQGRLIKYVVKPLSWVLRYKVYLKTSKYPRTFQDLLNGLTDENEIKIIKSYINLLTGKFTGSYKEFNFNCMNCAEALLSNI